jgi:hypothetical protein
MVDIQYVKQVTLSLYTNMMLDRQEYRLSVDKIFLSLELNGSLWSEPYSRVLATCEKPLFVYWTGGCMNSLCECCD